MGEVPTHVLARVFLNTTNSYKYLFLQALLSELERHGFRKKTLNLSDLFVEMAALAWYPHTYFRLSFGIRDQIGEILDRFHFQRSSSWAGSHANRIALRSQLRAQSEDIELDSTLSRYVHFRLLTPFFRPELAGKRDSQKNQLIVTFSQVLFDDRVPLYKIDGPESSSKATITVHPLWCQYFYRNLSIVWGWLMNSWVGYLQENNPSVPAVTKKVRMPERRNALNAQKSHWRRLIASKDLRCLYSGDRLNQNDFALDHFVPWSFVCHDQPWNLVPVIPSANSIKSDQLPDLDFYLDAFCALQAKFIEYTERYSSANAKNRLLDPYKTDLKLQSSAQISGAELKEAYISTLQPILSLAKQSGFRYGWVYEGS